MAASRQQFHFSGFTVSPARRALSRDGGELPLIPRYFDLLVLLIERRHEAVHRREILDAVWSDVVVSDGALNQAVRTLRRVLGDDPRQPRFIRTVARHGYRFVCDELQLEPDAPEDPRGAPGRAAPSGAAGPTDPFEPLLRRLLQPGDPSVEQDLERLETASRLHELGTAEALRRLDGTPGGAAGRAFLREARWDSPGAGPVPLLGRAGGIGAARVLIRLRLRRLLRLAGARWMGAILGGGAIGAVAGLLGGIALRFGPGSSAGTATPLLLALLGLVIGALGAAGVGAGLALAETLSRSWRGSALVALGAAGGGAVGASTHALAGLVLSGLFGRDLSAVTGGFEGLALGGAVGLGYQLGTRGTVEGLAAPRGRARLGVALSAGCCCAAAAVVLAATGSDLGAASLDLLARTFPGSQVGLDPLARLLGETAPGPRTRMLVAGWEGALFGLGTIAGFTRRPRPRPPSDESDADTPAE